jgi:hypothetical protein
LIAESCTSQNCLSFLVFDRIFSCHMIIKLRECIHLRLGPKALMKTRLNTNTQKNESVNRTLTKTNPKFGTWRRTLPGRIHGGVHMRNCGVRIVLFKLCFSHCHSEGFWLFRI